MNPEAKQASLVIDSVAKAVANWTVDRHAELNPKLPNRYGPVGRADWIGHCKRHLKKVAPQALIWLPSALVQVPCHGLLSRVFDSVVHRRLVWTNWIRTAAWSLRGLLVLYVLNKVILWGNR